MPREHGPAPSPTNATACHNPNPPNLHPGSTTLPPQQQMPAQNTPIAAPTPPRVHHIAPSATNTPTARNPNPSNPRPRSTIPHPRQQIHPLNAASTHPTRIQGAQHCTLSSRYPYPSPQSPRQPTPKEHCNAPSAAETPANHHPTPHSPRPRHTTLPPQQQMPAPTALTTAPSPPRVHHIAPSATNIPTARNPNPHPRCTTLHPRPSSLPFPITQPSTRSSAVGQLTQAHWHPERRHLATAPCNAIGHAAHQAFPPTFLIQVIPCHVNQRPLRIAKQFDAPLIALPCLCMMPPVIFHGDAPLRECKVEIIALLRTTLIRNINRHVDRRARQAVTLQQKPHLCLGR